MLWFFERNQQSLHLETTYDNDTSEIVVVVHWPDGREQTERFTDFEACQTRLRTLEEELEEARWRRTGPPVVLKEGWPNRRPTS
jgi:hypothetical protein